MRRVILTFVIAALVATGCGDDDPDTDAGIPNPASVYCEEQGGTTFGPEPMCELPDGTIVDAWDHYRERHPEDTQP